MKKIIIILIMVIGLSITSCKYSGNYDFIEKEEVVNSLQSYYANVTLINVNGSESSFTLVENGEYFYYSYNTSNYLVEKNSNKIYSIKHNEQKKLLERKTDFDYVENKNVLVDFLSEHISVVDDKYEMSKKIVSVGDFSCHKYEKETKVDAKNYIIRTYYIDDVTGYCIKSVTEICANGEKTITSWNIDELKFDEVEVNKFLNEITSYEEGLANIEFDTWPDMGLGALLPECSNGKFMFAVDYVSRATISIEQISSNDVEVYAKSLINYGFKEVKSTVLESSQNIYLTYNDDYVMVKIQYTPSRLNLTIRVSQSTKEEIDKELGNL